MGAISEMSWAIVVPFQVAVIVKAPYDRPGHEALDALVADFVPQFNGSGCASLYTTVTVTAGAVHRVGIDAVSKGSLLKGLEVVGLVREHLPEIEAFEARHFAAHPWLPFGSQPQAENHTERNQGFPP